MSSDLYAFDEISSHRLSSSDMICSDGGRDLLFFSNPSPYPFLSFTGSPIDEVKEFSNTQNTLDETPPSPDPFFPSFFSFSPPSTRLENQGLYQANGVKSLSNGSKLESEFGNFFTLYGSEVKSEECKMGVDYTYNQHFLAHSCSGAENVSKFMQRSFSCDSFEGKAGFLFHPNCDTLMDSPNFQRHTFSSPEKIFFTGQTRRVCSTGDLQSMKATHTSQRESSLMEEVNFKVGRYSTEERKEKISKYRAKRSQRKFYKTIKYACRKALAENRTRIRGRFARNHETSEIPKGLCSSRDEEDEDKFWIELIEGLHDDDGKENVPLEQNNV